MDGHPCPDCRWTLYLMTGRPIAILRCKECLNWFHANTQVTKSVSRVLGQGLRLDVMFNHDCTKDDLNSMLRCDCLAKQIYMIHNLTCNNCTGTSTTPVRHAVEVFQRHTLHTFITQLVKTVYNKSSLPAYTLQRRCGAVEAYLDRYMKEVMTPTQTVRTLAYRKKRLEIREALNARQDDSTRSASSIDNE